MESEASSSAESPGSVVSDAVASVSIEVDSEPRVPSPVSEQEEFLSGEEEPEPEFETASELPFVPEPDEEVEPDDRPTIQPAAAMEEENSKDAPSSASYHESFPMKDEARIDETDGLDQKSSSPPAVDSKSLLSESDLRNEDEAELDKSAEDGDEKNKSLEEIRTSESLDEAPEENTKCEVSSHESLSKESGKDGGLHDDPVLNGADDAPPDTVEIEHSETSKGNEEVIPHLVQDSDADKVLPGTLELENSNPREDPEVTVQENGDDNVADSDDNNGVTLIDEQELQASETLEIPSHDSTQKREIALNLEKAESIDMVDAIEQALAELQSNSVNSKLVDASPEDEQKVSAIEEHLISVDSPNLESSEIAPAVEYSGAIEARVAEKEEEEEEEEEEEGDVDDYDDDDTEVDVRRIMKELEQGSSNQMDGQIVSDSEEEIEAGEERQVRDFFDPETLTALLKAAANASSDESITISAVDRPAGLGSSIPSLKPTPNRSIRSSLFPPSDMAQSIQEENPIDDEDKKLQDKVDQIRVKFLRLVNRLGQSPEDRVAAQVLYRLGLAEGIKRGKQLNRGHSMLENSKKKAFLLEEQDKEGLDFSCNILIIGKTGVGKSATINSIFGEEKVSTNAFESSTKSIRPILGTVDGIKLRVTDTPGLKPSVMDQMANKRILESIKRYTKRFPPDIILYVDRLDTQTWDFNDLPLLRSVSSILGSSLWFNAIVALTHSATAPPDGPTGTPLSYEGFIDQRSRIVQHAIRQAAGDMRLMNPVALVENHPLCRKNREGHRILPNGLSWRQQLLLLCYSSKILSEANSLLKLQEPSPAKLFGFRVRSPPLPYLLSSLLQSRAHPKMGGDGGDSDVDLGESSDSDLEEEEEEYDQLPPFKPLRKAQLAKLTNEQRNAYYEEYDYRVKLLQKKQLKEMKKMKRAGQREDVQPDDFDQDGAPAAVPVPLPDMILPPSFDSDNPVHRFRFLEPTSQLLTRPVLDSHGWDHDCGYDGVSLEDSLSILNRFPAGFTLQLTKDKKEFNVHFDSSVSSKHGETGSTLAGFDVQSVGKQLAYILRGESKFRTFRNNKTAAGVALTLLGEHVATGVKLEDQLLVGKRFGLVGSTGVVRAQGDMAYGANMEVRVRDKEFPVSQDVSTLGLSLMRWRGDMALGANLQSQVSVGRGSKVAVRVGLNNKLSGQITIRTSTSDQLQIALMGVLPVATYIYRTLWDVESY